MRVFATLIKRNTSSSILQQLIPHGPILCGYQPISTARLVRLVRHLSNIPFDIFGPTTFTNAHVKKKSARAFGGSMTYGVRNLPSFLSGKRFWLSEEAETFLQSYLLILICYLLLTAFVLHAVLQVKIAHHACGQSRCTETIPLD